MPKPDSNPSLFVLEGRLAGEWAKELIRVTRKIPLNQQCVFDLEDVFYVDSLGEETLCWLNRMGATFVTETAYGKDLCERLHLHRMTADETSAREGRKRRSTEPHHPAVPSLSRPRSPS